MINVNSVKNKMVNDNFMEGVNKNNGLIKIRNRIDL